MQDFCWSARRVQKKVSESNRDLFPGLVPLCPFALRIVFVEHVEEGVGEVGGEVGIFAVAGGSAGFFVIGEFSAAVVA